MTLTYGEETLLGSGNLSQWIRKGYTIYGKYNFCYGDALLCIFYQKNGGDLPYQICAIFAKTKMVCIFAVPSNCKPIKYTNLLQFNVIKKKEKVKY